MRMSAGPVPRRGSACRPTRPPTALREFFVEFDDILKPIPAAELEKTRTTSRSASRRVRDLAQPGAEARGAGRLQPARGHLPDVRAARSRRSPLADVQKAAAKLHPARQDGRGHRRRSARRLSRASPRSSSGRSASCRSRSSSNRPHDRRRRRRRRTGGGHLRRQRARAGDRARAHRRRRAEDPDQRRRTMQRPALAACAGALRHRLGAARDARHAAGVAAGRAAPLLRGRGRPAARARGTRPASCFPDRTAPATCAMAWWRWPADAACSSATTPPSPASPGTVGDGALTRRKAVTWRRAWCWPPAGCRCR